MDTRISSTPEQTQGLGRELARQLTPGSVVGLVGELGAGKTQFVKGIAQGLGITERVHSPTFNLVNEYTSGEIGCYHLDLYRLETPAQILSAGLDHYLFQDRAVTLVEWFDRWSADLPKPSKGWLILIEAPTVSERLIRYEPFGS